MQLILLRLRLVKRIISYNFSVSILLENEFYTHHDDTNTVADTFPYEMNNTRKRSRTR